MEANTVELFKEVKEIENSSSPLRSKTSSLNYQIDSLGANLYANQDKGGTSPLYSGYEENYQFPKFLLNEDWEQVHRIQSKISKITESKVICYCLTDPEKFIFQMREFPKDLFKNIPLEIGKYVIIKMSQKPGVLKFEFLDGKGRVNTEPFEMEDDISKFEGFTTEMASNEW